MGASAAGGVIAFYQLGYGIAAFGTGPRVDAGVGRPALFGFAAIAAVIMDGLSFVLAARTCQPPPRSPPAHNSGRPERLPRAYHHRGDAAAALPAER